MEDTFWLDFLHEISNGSHSNSLQGLNQGHDDTQVPNQIHGGT